MSLESDVAYISHHRVQPACLDELDDAPDVIAEPAPAPPVRRQPITSPTADAPRNLGPRRWRSWRGRG
ncbi:MAG TPA: hypothetical protein PJ982_17960 [Lacipirellulaceae bacterium]|nr:hypothetical protein [Lacipirellulaceae bacterium]